MAINTKGRFNIALADQGFILQGQPNTPSYVTAQAPVYGTRFASGDRDYNDLSQWWYLIQTDWSGGIKDTLPWEDDAKFYYSTNVDARTRGGSVRLEKELTAFYTAGAANGDDEILSYKNVAGDGYFITNGNGIVTDNGTDVFTTGGTNVHDFFKHRGQFWRLGSGVIYGSGSFPISPTTATSHINSVIDGSIDSVTAHVVIGNTLYLFGISDTDNVFCVKTSVAAPASSADYSLVFETSLRNNLGATVAGADSLGGEILILVEGSPVWSLWILNVASGVATFAKDFPGSQLGIYSKGVRFAERFGMSEVLLTIVRDEGSNDGTGTIWSYNGQTLTKIYDTDQAKLGFTSSSYEAIGWLRTGAVMHGDNAYWGNLVYTGEYFFNHIKRLDESLVYPAVPIGSNGDVMYFVDTEEISGQDQSIVYSYDETGTAYKAEGFIVFNQHDKLQSIDKLLHNINLGFEQLENGEEIEVYYSELPLPTPNIADWTLLGEATHAVDGGSATFKVLSFPVGVDPKKVWFRVNFKGPGTSTPSMTDFTLEYLPVPDYRRQWVVNINCSDGVNLLDGKVDERTAREMAGFLEQLWLGKKIIEFQDVEYAATKLTAGIDDNDTTIPVRDTRDFPEAGRLFLDDEEMLYSGKTPKSFTGVTRGAQGTVPAAHISTATISAGLFNVIITNYERRIPLLLTDKKIESVVQLTLRETGVI